MGRLSQRQRAAKLRPSLVVPPEPAAQRAFIDATVQRMLNPLEADHHVDAWLDAPPIDDSDGVAAAREFLEFSRLPAWEKLKRDEPSFFVTCVYRDAPYWLAGASRLGDVWLRRTRPDAAVGPYEKRVDIQECTEWRREPRNPAHVRRGDGVSLDDV